MPVDTPPLPEPAPAEGQADKWRKMFEAKSAASRRFEPCSGHVGKVDNQRDGCPWCKIERQGTIIDRLRQQVAQLKGALGYPVPADIPEGPWKCGLCEAKTKSMVQAEAQVAQMRAALDDIANGKPKVLPSLDQSPADFRSAMWTWSQQRAREALSALPQREVTVAKGATQCQL